MESLLPRIDEIPFVQTRWEKERDKKKKKEKGREKRYTTPINCQPVKQKEEKEERENPVSADPFVLMNYELCPLFPKYEVCQRAIDTRDERSHVAVPFWYVSFQDLWRVAACPFVHLNKKSASDSRP